MDFLLTALNTNDLWIKIIKPIPTCSFDEDIFVNSMKNELLITYKQEILNIIAKIINNEISKRENIDMRKKILIRDQIYNNMVENINNMVHNMAKEQYDNYIKEIEETNKEIQQTQSNDLFDSMVEDNNVIIPFEL